MFQVVAPMLQALGQTARVVRIGYQQGLEPSRIALGHASPGTDQCGNPPAQRFVNSQAVAFIACGMNQGIAGRQQPWHVLAEAQEKDSLPQSCKLRPFSPDG